MGWLRRRSVRQLAVLLLGCAVAAAEFAGAALAQIQECAPLGDIAAPLGDILSRQQAVLNSNHPTLERTRAVPARLEPPATP